MNPLVCDPLSDASADANYGTYVLTDPKREHALQEGGIKGGRMVLSQYKYDGLKSTTLMVRWDGELHFSNINGDFWDVEVKGEIPYFTERQRFTPYNPAALPVSGKLDCAGRLFIKGVYLMLLDTDIFIDREQPFGTTTDPTLAYQFAAWDRIYEGDLQRCLTTGDTPGEKKCQEFVNEYCSLQYPSYVCSRHPDLNQLCSNYKCDAAASKYCPTDPLARDCGCFLDRKVYDDFFQELSNTYKVKYPHLPQCFYGPCAESAYRPPGAMDQECPSMVTCIQDITYNVDGSISNVTTSQEQACGMEASLPEFKYSCQRGSCIEVEEGTGEFKTSDCESKCPLRLRYACVEGKCTEVTPGEGQFDEPTCEGCGTAWQKWVLIIGGIVLIVLLVGGLIKLVT